MAPPQLQRPTSRRRHGGLPRAHAPPMAHAECASRAFSGEAPQPTPAVRWSPPSAAAHAAEPTLWGAFSGRPLGPDNRTVKRVAVKTCSVGGRWVAPAPSDGNWPNPPIRNLAGFLVWASLPTRCLRGPVLSCRAPRSASDRCRPEHCRAADHHHHTGGRVLESPDMAKRRRRTLQGAIGARGARYAARCE